LLHVLQANSFQVVIQRYLLPDQDGHEPNLWEPL
jgi:hypothetical protein